MSFFVLSFPAYKGIVEGRPAGNIRIDMQSRQSAIVPPAPVVHTKDLPTLRLMLTALRSSLDIWPSYAFDVPFNRSTMLGVEFVLLNDPAAIRHVMVTNAANYVRPVVMPRILRPLLGRGLFLSEGAEWRRQRRVLSPPFTPHSVGLLLPHFAAAAADLVRQIERAPIADLSAAFQTAALEAGLRAMFSLPDSDHREKLGGLVRAFVSGPGRPGLLDNFAPSEASFPILLRGRRAFQKVWFATVDDVVSARKRAPRVGAHRDLLDMLLAARDAETGESLADEEIRDQCAGMIFGGFETTARLLFWAAYLLTLDRAEQARLEAEIAAFPPDRVATLDDLSHWPRLRMVLLETLRLYPPVPLLNRRPVANDEIMGEPVGPRTQVWISPWVMHRHRAHWTDPTAFMPERFAGKPAPWTTNGAYLPFGAGSRTCVGAAFAMAEAQIMMAALLARFRMTLDNGPTVMPVGRLTIEPSRAPLFRIERM
jgi:cytochrome P450